MAGTPPQPSATIASGPSNSDPTNPTDPVDQQTSSTTAAQDEADVLSRMFARLDAETPTNLGRSEPSPTQATLVGGRAAATDDAGSEGTDVGEVWEDAAEDLASDAGDAAEETWTIARLEAALAMAEEFKMKANSEFSPGKAFHQALTTYLSALAAIPDRPAEPDPKGKRRALNSDEGIRIEEVDDAEAARIESGATAEEVQRADLEERCRMLRAVLWSNMAAVYLKLGQNKEAAESCTEALKDDPEHVKALLRRSTANIAIGTWSTLTTAEDDYKKLLGLLPPSSPLRAHAQQELRSLPDRIKTRAEEEKGEMLGKLKDLGNTLLGNFGLSTDNFKFEPNGSGGYGMSFVR